MTEGSQCSTLSTQHLNFFTGFLSLKKERFKAAAGYLEDAERREDELGTYFNRYGITAAMSLPITDEVSAHVGPDLRGVLLGLVETYQRLERGEDAVAALERLRRLEPDDVAVKLSLAELLLDLRRDEKPVCQQVVQLAEGIENESPIHAALLLYKARALRQLGLTTAARDTLSVALRRKKDRPADLLHALRYERALTYEAMGQKARARADLERIYAEAPEYRDVAKRLGMD